MANERVCDLVLLRHGPAEEREAWSGKNDLQRPLTEKGVRRVRQVARGLAKLRVAPERILTSPAVRALHTARLVAEMLELEPARIHEEQALLPEASPEDLLGVLASLECAEVLCVGHEPHLDEVLAALLGLRHGRGSLALKKAGAALLRVHDIERGDAELRAWLSPAMLRRIGRR